MRTSATDAAKSAPPSSRWSAVRHRIRRLLPTGETLPQASWARRHRQITILLWAHVLALPPLGVAFGETLPHALSESGLLLVFAAGASLRHLGAQTRAALATLGLVTASAVLTHFSGGLIEMHFHFFVVVVVISLYQSWRPLLLAVAYVIIHHGLMGAVDPGSVYNHPAALANPWKWALIHGLFIFAQSAACLAAWRVNEDALERERATRGQLQRANVDLAEAQALSSVGSWDWEVATDIVTWSEELYRIAGVDHATFDPSLEGFLELIHPEDRFRVAAIIGAARESHSAMDYRCRMIRADGEVRAVHALGQAVLASDGTLQKLMGTLQDITERERLEDEIEFRAFHDALTGLGNRALFLDRVEHAMAVWARSAAPVTVLYLDVDDFKTINDSLGHSTGDAVLVELAGRIAGAVRAADTVARLGGDEFAVLLENTDVAAAWEVAERIDDAARAPLSLHAQEVFPQVSIGIAAAEAGAAAGDVLRNADIAMYAAKRTGAGGPRVFTPEMLSSVITRMQLQADLKGALERGEFVLHYQPIVELESGEAEALEALVRWNHPERGIVAPNEFIPLAEESGLIVALGAWVTEQAARDVRALSDELDRPFTVNVNLSPAQLSSDIVGMVEQALERSGLAPSALVIEVTETSLMREDEGIVAKLQALRSLGVRVAIDDFGTGYSSLAYLQKLPIDILKIDRRFVDTVAEGPEQSALAHAIVRLARIFGLATVGEGIEHDDQRRVLHGFGCEAGQGFYLCRPQPLVDLRTMLGEPTVRTVQPV